MKLSVVIPIYNGAKTIERLVQDLFETLSKKVDLQMVLVNDCSSDDSWEKLENLHRLYADSLIAVDLSKNFGEHNAVIAGYHFCEGEYIVNIDDDFQNPPSEILRLLDKIQEGHDVVYSSYAKKKHSLFRNFGSRLNNVIANIMLKKPKDLYLSSFRIISASTLRQITKYDGPYPYIDGLILRATSKIAQVQVEHIGRAEGASGYTLLKLFYLWSHVFLNFSLVSLRFATILGLLFGLLGFVGATVVIVEKVIYPEIQIGWTSIILSVLILSGIQLFMMGIIGEYVGRIFLSQNKTPQFVVDRVLNFPTAGSGERVVTKDLVY